MLARWNDADVALSDAEALTSLLPEVHPDEEVRALAEEGGRTVSQLRSERDLDPDLFAAMAALAPVAGDPDGERLRLRVLRDFRRAGVDQPAQRRERLRVIADRLTQLEQDFNRGIRDDVREIRVRPEQLDGLPADYVAARPPGPDGLVAITTEYPDAIPFRTFARDATARRSLAEAMGARAWPGNDAVLAEMLALRAEQAQLVGYADWPDYDAAVKMVGSGAAIEAFIEQIAAAAEARGRREVAVLLERAREDDPGAQAVSRADAAYYEELVRRRDFDVDASAVRGYFPFDRVRAGLLEVTAALFGVRYRARPDAPVWHPDVAVYDVLADGAEDVVGRIYLDLHPRPAKYQHAAQFDLARGVAGRQLPEGVLVCNFSRGLMEHSDVVTAFHEFGHLMHHVLAGAQRYVRFSGVATEWDFVEAPSQLLEEWAWDPAVLARFARDADGAPIPAELVARMRAADEFGQGALARTQMAYAAIAYRLHRDRPADQTAAVRALQDRYDLFAAVPGTHFHTAFGHLAGYSSAYYTYMWSLVIAKDLLSGFDRGDLLDPQVAARYRDEVLAPGGSRDAADLVAAFLGRAYSFDAFRRWLSG